MKPNTHSEFLTKFEFMIRAMMTVWVTTHEEERFIVSLRGLVNEFDESFKVLSWSLTEGLLDLMPYLKLQPGGMYRQPERIGMTAPVTPDRFGIPPPPGQAPLVPVIHFEDFCEYVYQNCANKLFIIKDVHNLLDPSRPTYPTFVRKIRDLIYHNRSSIEGDAGYLTFLAPVAGIPIDLEKDIQTLDMPLPNDHDIGKTIDVGLNDFRAVNPALKIDIPFTDGKGKLVKSKNADGEVLRNQAIFNLKGLTQSEISQVINYSTVANNGLHGNFLADIREQKRQIIEETGFLEFLDIPDTVGVGGHDTFKAYVARRGLYLIPKYRKVYSLKPPRGTLLMGIPGTGKSILARYIAWKWAVPLIRLDMSAIMGSLLGQSEGRINEALKIAEANAPCILFIDEVEKAVGESHGDSGTSSRIFGKLLTWMSEREEMVYLFCTANKISRLPGEFLRPGRFDKIFWTDLPDVAECRDILGIHAKLNNIELPNDDLFDIAKYCWDEQMTGAEIEQGVIDANVAVAERAMMIGEDIKVGPEAVRACLEEIRPKMKNNPEGYNELRIKALKDFDFTSKQAYERLKKEFQNR